MKQINIKVDVPDGFVLDKIETEGETIVAFVKEKERFKRGDVISGDGWVCIFKYAGVYNEAWYFACLEVNTEDLYITNKLHCGYIEDFTRLATPSEAQLLFDALAKEGKKWNPETLQIEEIEKDILVPESIGIYRCREDFGTDGDGLYLAFNNNTQLLNYNSKYKTWCVFPLHSGYEKVQCKLTPCKLEDLRAGDTFLMKEILQYVEDILYNPSEYVKSMTARANEFAWIDEDTDVILSKMDDSHKQLYKVEPITK